MQAAKTVKEFLATVPEKTLKEFVKKNQSYIGQAPLPKSWDAAIDSSLQKYKRYELKKSIERIKTCFNSHRTTLNTTMTYGELEATAFLPFMPLFYAPMYNIYSQLQKTNFNPSSMLDFGCGPGTAIWATKDFFKIQTTLAIDESSHMIQHTKSFHELHEYSHIKLSTKISDRVQTNEQFDLVVSSFTLADLANDIARQKIVESLWMKTKDVLVLVDRGTPWGSTLISNARQQLLDLAKKEGTMVHIVAPVCLNSDAICWS